MNQSPCIRIRFGLGMYCVFYNLSHGVYGVDTEQNLEIFDVSDNDIRLYVMYSVTAISLVAISRRNFFLLSASGTGTTLMLQ